jgi:hypothetical protein
MSDASAVRFFVRRRHDGAARAPVLAVPRATILMRAIAVSERSLYAHNCDVIQSTFT